MSARDQPETSRIAIKFGKSLSDSTRKPGRSLPSSRLGKRQRPSNELGGNSDPESENEGHTNGRHERITAFGANGAELDQRERGRGGEQDGAKRGPLTIQRQPNRDWRAEAKTQNQRGHRPPMPKSVATPGSQEESGRSDGDKPIKWGLTVTKSVAAPVEGDGQEATGDGEQSNSHTDTLEQPPENAGADEDKEAVDALLGRTTDARTKTKRVIERAASTATEADVFGRDYHDAPDASTLEEYEAMPVEEFGAALLRGMGWDGKDRGPKVKQVVRRPSQMGLGAKELKGAEDLGAWNHRPGSSTAHRQRPPRLHDYRREEDKRRERREERYRDSYKSERDRERDERRGGDGHHSSSSSSRRHSHHHYR